MASEILTANPKIVADLKAGKAQAAGNLIGQAKKRNPNVNPARFREICLELVWPKCKLRVRRPLYLSNQHRK